VYTGTLKLAFILYVSKYMCLNLIVIEVFDIHVHISLNTCFISHCMLSAETFCSWIMLQALTV